MLILVIILNLLVCLLHLWILGTGRATIPYISEFCVGVNAASGVACCLLALSG